MDTDELYAALRAALHGEVQMVPFNPDFPDLETRGRDPRESLVLGAPVETFNVQLAAPVEKKRLSLNTPGTKRIARALDTALGRLADPGPRHPSLKSHRINQFDKHFGAPVWESYVQKNVPAAWRMWWFYDTNAERTITVAAIGPHPDNTTTPPRT